MFTALGEPEMIFAPYQRLLNRLPLWLAKPLGACSYCLTGQVSLWYYVITKPFKWNYEFIIELLFFVSLSVFLIAIYEKIWKIYE
jgi:hypothetical protein